MKKTMPIFGAIMIASLTLINCGGGKTDDSLGGKTDDSLGGIVVYENNGYALVVAPTDLGMMNWADAIEACYNLKLNGYDDWHLPTSKELDSLYVNLHKKGVGGFANGWYWSSSGFGMFGAWQQNFDNGEVAHSYNPNDYVYVRAVRTVDSRGGIVVYENNGHGLVAATTDLKTMVFGDAIYACEDLILNGYDDWYLPTQEELNSLYINLRKKGVGGFANGLYWSRYMYNNDGAWVQDFSNGDTSLGFRYTEYNVRAVRAF